MKKNGLTQIEVRAIVTTGTVIQIAQKRAENRAAAAAKDGQRFLMQVSPADSKFLSYYYEHGHEKSALRLLKIAKDGPDWGPDERILTVLYVTEGEVEFLRFMNQNGPTAAARAQMKSINRPIPDEAGSWGKVLPISDKVMRKSRKSQDSNGGVQ